MTFGYIVTCKCLDEEYTGFGSDDRACLLNSKNFPNQSSAFGQLSEEVYLATQQFKESEFLLILNGKPLKFKYPEKDWREDPPRKFVCKNCRKEKTLNASWFWDGNDNGIFLCNCDGELQEIGTNER